MGMSIFLSVSTRHPAALLIASARRTRRASPRRSRSTRRVCARHTVVLDHDPAPRVALPALQRDAFQPRSELLAARLAHCARTAPRAGPQCSPALPPVPDGERGREQHRQHERQPDHDRRERRTVVGGLDGEEHHTVTVQPRAAECITRCGGCTRFRAGGTCAHAARGAAPQLSIWSALRVFVCCSPPTSRPRSTRNPRVAAATLNASLGRHLVESSSSVELSG